MMENVRSKSDLHDGNILIYFTGALTQGSMPFTYINHKHPRPRTYVLPLSSPGPD